MIGKTPLNTVDTEDNQTIGHLHWDMWEREITNNDTGTAECVGSPTWDVWKPRSAASCYVNVE